MSETPVSNAALATEDAAVVAALRQGDEKAFAALVTRYHAALVRVAMAYVRDRTTAEDVAQETWLGVIDGIDRFEGRSSLKTWIFRILTNRAKTRAQRERRTVPFSSLGAELDRGEPAVDPERFLPPDATNWPGHWASAPARWDTMGEDRLLSKETLHRIHTCIAALPPNQRRVVILRDVEGWSPPEVCDLLEISEANQRVLLHRARSHVRRALERYLTEEDGTS
ncbi:MAG: RNA polymerase sigma factor [Acidimicrobiales bacterium]